MGYGENEGEKKNTVLDSQTLPLLLSRSSSFSHLALLHSFSSPAATVTLLFFSHSHPLLPSFSVEECHTILLHPNPFYHQFVNLLSTLTLYSAPQHYHSWPFSPFSLWPGDAVGTQERDAPKSQKHITPELQTCRTKSLDSIQQYKVWYSSFFLSFLHCASALFIRIENLGAPLSSWFCPFLWSIGSFHVGDNSR